MACKTVAATGALLHCKDRHKPERTTNGRHSLKVLLPIEPLLLGLISAQHSVAWPPFNASVQPLPAGFPYIPLWADM